MKSCNILEETPSKIWDDYNNRRIYISIFIVPSMENLKSAVTFLISEECSQ